MWFFRWFSTCLSESSACLPGFKAAVSSGVFRESSACLPECRSLPGVFRSLPGVFRVSSACLPRVLVLLLLLLLPGVFRVSSACLPECRSLPGVFRSLPGVFRKSSEVFRSLIINTNAVKIGGGGTVALWQCRCLTEDSRKTHGRLGRQTSVKSGSACRSPTDRKHKTHSSIS